MKKTFAHVIGGWLLGSLLIFSAPAAAQPSIVDIFSQTESTWGAKISPDGNTLAIGCVHEGKRSVCISPLAGDVAPTLYPAPNNADIVNFYWASPDHVIIVNDLFDTTYTGDGVEGFRLFRAISFNVRTQTTAVLLKNYRQYSNTSNVVSLLEDKPNKVLMTLGGGRSYFIFEVNLDTGAARQKSGQESAKSVYSALYSPTGERRITTIYLSSREDFEIVEGKNNIVYKRRDASQLPWSVLSFTEDGEDILVWSEGESVSGYGRGVWRMSLDDGGLSRVKVGDFEIGAHPPIEDPQTNRAVGFSYTDGRYGLSDQFFTDPEMDQIQTALMKALDADVVRIESWTPDRSRYVVVTENRGEPANYYVFAKDTGQLSLVGSSYDAASRTSLGELARINYKASDGLEIPGYLTLPPGKTKDDGPFPVLLMPHGGPDAFDNASYDWWSHAYAAAGYAVLRPNFRGSSGFGSEFREAGFGEFGGKMVTDVIDGLKWMEQEGLARPGGACIIGASYGGYSALMAPLLSAGDIRCAISVNGVTDPIALMGNLKGRGRNSAGVEYWEQYMGDLFGSREAHAEITPRERVSEYRTPVLLIHGDEDTRVDFSQFQRFVREAGKTSWLQSHVMKGENHFMSTQSAKKQILELSLAFLDEYHPVGDPN